MTGAIPQDVIRRLRDRQLLGKANTFNQDIFQHNANVNPLWQRDVKWHFGCVNAVELSRKEDFVVSGGDDTRVAVWRIRDLSVSQSPSPVAVMEEQHMSNIFALGFSLHSDRVYSAGNDGCFKVHDLQTRKHIRTWEADRPYYRLSPHPTDDNVISIACSDGNVYIYDIRQPDGNTHLQPGGEVFSVTYNHVQPNLLAVCSRPAGLTIYDLRKTQDHYVRAGEFTKRAFYSDWSENGDGIFCAVSQSSPYYFNLNTSDYVQMDDPGYINVCTVKSCTVAGNYALVGGDDWNIYVWKIPTDPSEMKKVEEAYTVLKGHRSVVNHVRYSQSSQMLISCGVEKIIKCWSMFPLCDAVRNPKRRQRGRPIDLLAAMHTYDSGDLCPEEDLYTLYQFDQYYEAAIRKPRYDSDESDDDSLESFAYDYLSHYVADFDSDESMSSEVPDIDLTDNIGIDDLFTNMS